MSNPGTVARNDGFKGGSFSGIKVHHPPGGVSSFSFGGDCPWVDPRGAACAAPAAPAPPAHWQAPGSAGSSASYMSDGARDFSSRGSFSGTRRLAPPGGFSSMGAVLNHDDAAVRNERLVRRAGWRFCACLNCPPASSL